MGRAFEVRKASMAKTGLAKTKLYTKFSKEIYMAAKNGTPDPEANLNLRHVIERAKKNQVPADVINRAVDKAKNAGGEEYQAVRYEGFGPGGSTLIVDCLTDNVNRSVSEVKNAFTKNDSKMGVSGSVAHLYDTLGVIEVRGISEDDAMDLLIRDEVDVEDLEQSDESLVIYVAPADLHKALKSLNESDHEVDISTEEITLLPQIEAELSEDELIVFNKLLAMLNEVDDVQEVYHNVVNL